MKRLSAEDRKQAILLAAAEAAVERGYKCITRDEVAYRAGVQGPLVLHYFESMEALKREVRKYAIKFSIYPVIAQAVVHGEMEGIDDDLRYAAMSYMARPRPYD